MIALDCIGKAFFFKVFLYSLDPSFGASVFSWSEIFFLYPVIIWHILCFKKLEE